MGASPYWYIVKHGPDVNAVLQALRQREFQAGRYYPATDDLDFPPDEHSPRPGAAHATIEEAQEAADAEGTQTILDLDRISDEPEMGCVSRLRDETLIELFGTAQPTREQYEEGEDALWDIEEFDERGQGVYFTLYKNGKPDEMVFAGYSFD